MSTTPKLALTYLEEAQASAEVPHNDALNRLDFLTSISIKDRDLATPPGSPATGDTYLVATSGTGAWTGKDGKLASYYGGWVFATVKSGMIVHVQDEDIFIARTQAGTWVTITVT